MLQINIQRPLSLLVVIGVIVGFVKFTTSSSDEQSLSGQAVGSSGEVHQQAIHEVNLDIRRNRQQREVLERKEEILRHQLNVLEDELAKLRRKQFDPEEKAKLIGELSDTAKELRELIQDKYEAEAQILAGLRELWDAEARGSVVGNNDARKVRTLLWPVAEVERISAGYLDNEYEALFGLPHNAIDIPVNQGTIVMAAADGTVEQVVDNGFGYNSLILQHGGTATLYGHVSAFLVAEGDVVKAGDAIALSGGTPGTKGAGTMTTGAHLHFEVIEDGVRIDPMRLLPKYLPDGRSVETL